ncbi:MAG: O-antigen ligase family protein [Thermomicrobiales bacterium]
MGDRQRYLIAGLVAVASCGAIVISGRLDAATALVGPLAALIGAIGLIGTLGPARGGVVALLLMATVNRYTAEIGGASIKPEHIAAPLVALALAPRLPKLLKKLRLVDFLLLAWLAWSVVGGLLNAPDPRDSTELWAMLLVVAFAYFAIVTTVRTSGRLIFAVDVWMVIGIAAGLFGIASHLLYAWNVNLGIQINPVTADPTVPSTFRESNLFGSAMMILALAGLGLLALDYRRRRLPGMAAVVGFVGLQISFTRTAWAAFVFGILLLAMVLLVLSVRNAYRIPSDVFRPIGYVALAAVAVTALVWMPIGDPDTREQREARFSENATREARIWASATAGEADLKATLPPLSAGTPTVHDVPTPSPENPDIVGRVGSITDTSDSSLRIRIDFARQALRDWRDYPVVGGGIGSFGQKYTTTSLDRAWLSNTFVRTLHDSGIVGLMLFLSPILLLAVSGLRLTDRISGDLDRLALSLGIAVAGMFVAFQATEGFQLAWYWIVLGLYAAAVRLAVERRHRIGWSS